MYSDNCKSLDDKGRAVTCITNKFAVMLRLCPALIGVAFIVGAANAADTTQSPYRLTTAGAEQWLYRPTPDLQDDHYLPGKPNDTRPYARQIALAANKSGLDPELVHAVIAVESAYQPAAVSPKGAVGLMQVLPETAQLYGVHNPSDVAANLRAGTRHLSGLMQHFDNRLDLALAAYNAGEGAVRSHNNSIPPYPETRSYVPAVVARYRENRPGAVGGTQLKPVAKNYLPGTRLDPRALQQLP